MNNNPLITVIIPVYNGERYLAQAIESVQAQSYRPFEVIVVDDGSTDGSAEVAKRFEPLVQYVFQPQSGAAAARNRGSKVAKGSFLAFLDADDLWVEEKLALQMAAFENETQLDAVFGHIEQFISPDLDQSEASRIKCPAHKIAGYSSVTMLIRREAFLRVGRFDTHWQVGEFIDWYLKSQEEGLRTLMLPDVVLRRRLHTTNMGIRERDERIDYVRILKAALDRRRQKALSS